MVSAVSSSPSTDGVAFNRLLWVAPLTILPAVIGDVVAQQLAVAVLQPDPGFMPLSLLPPIIFTAYISPATLARSHGCTKYVSSVVIRFIT